ncbi:Acetyltransferase (GNAT) family protein [Sphingomonas sp. YR710]|uniref:GNAT family N-acetyltransferase n=1 Tax=Sphingomonas sp. YR710 TaxID=1882773 RepID=UPI0008841030|nr:GNAT family N-acetyltransferase [Sphingomonas sp. YR710]SDD26102.1 Acetyltransferase (GNAT) family protein [Sphingomonas sp. YR710]
MATLPDNRLSLRPMSSGDIAAVHALSKAEKWPHRSQDLSAMLAIGSGLVAEMGGAIVASTMWWPCGDDIASLGIVIVARTHRGSGLGRIIMETALDQIGDRAVILNATESGLPLYRKLGFNGVSEIHQHQGASFAAPLVPLAEGERIRPIGASDAAPVAALVEAATGLHRPALMTALLEKGHGLVLDRDGVLTGFALFRRFGRGYVIGPVVAPDRERAKALIAQWLGMRSGEFTRLDITGDSGLGDWLENLGIVKVDRAITMVRGKAPHPIGPARAFAIVSQALC